ncbi:Hint domain-containing protein [uncultured Fibrella sp.]|uniref:Hint domain-containing protein n=1 Tax=uncultured Fibrella sp. TaxID=1284596 RepID=UPI0035CBD6AA
MKRTLPYFFFLAAAFVASFFAQRVMAQTATPGTLTAEQATALKALKINNLEKDTYVKSGGFILERYEDRPAYVFNYSDGIKRKIYLYKVYSAADTKDLGLLAIYQNGKTNELKSFVIPGAAGEPKAWDAYLDDMKYVGEKEPGLMPALAFVISREMAMLMGGGAGKTEEGGAKKKEEYNFCFGPQSLVTLADGGSKAIVDVREGDVVMSYDAAKQALSGTRVTALNTHPMAGEATLVGIWTVPTNQLTASVALMPAPAQLLEATANHPVLTTTGRKALGEVAVGELVYRCENGATYLARVVRTGSTGRAAMVYSLTTEKGNYVVAGTVVLDK